MGFEGGKKWADWSDSELMVGIMVENTEVLEDLDDVQQVYSNADIADDILAQL